MASVVRDEKRLGDGASETPTFRSTDYEERPAKQHEGVGGEREKQTREDAIPDAKR